MADGNEQVRVILREIYGIDRVVRGPTIGLLIGDGRLVGQEVRLASAGGGAFEWLAGAFYQHIDREYGQALPTPGYDALLARRGHDLGPKATLGLTNKNRANK